MSTQSIVGVLNKNFSNALWVPRDHQLDPDLPAYFQNAIKTYMGSDSRKEFQCVEMRSHVLIQPDCVLYFTYKCYYLRHIQYDQPM